MKTAYTNLKCSRLRLGLLPSTKCSWTTARDAPLNDRSTVGWHCPNGHYQQYTTSAFEQEKKRRIRAEEREKSALASLESYKRRAAALEQLIQEEVEVGEAQYGPPPTRPPRTTRG